MQTLLFLSLMDASTLESLQHKEEIATHEHWKSKHNHDH